MTRAAFLREELSSKFAHIFPKFDEMCCRRDGVHNRHQDATSPDVPRDADQSISGILECAGAVVVVGQIVAFDNLFLNLRSHCNFPARFGANRAQQNAHTACDARTSEHSSGHRENYACNFLLPVPSRNNGSVSSNRFATGART